MQGKDIAQVPIYKTITRAELEEWREHGYASRREDGRWWLLHADEKTGGTTMSPVEVTA